MNNLSIKTGLLALKRTMHILALLSVLSISSHAAGQEANLETGIVSGRVIDVDYGGTVYDAIVTIVELGKTERSNMDGRYRFSSIPVGEYTLVVSADYYKTVRVTEVTVTKGEAAKVDIPLYGDSSDVIQLASFEVTASVLENSDLGLLNVRQKATVVSDSIGSESFGRLGLGDAADALTKVTGVSITDGKYMVVRGLSDRYNNTTMNGASVPSSDPDKRAVQLDQFPTGIIDSITTIKTFTPDMSGSFTAGNVDIETKSVPDRSFATTKIGVGYNENTTFKEILSSQSSGDDWLGKDDGMRSIPELGTNRDEIPGNPIGYRKDEEKKALISDLTQSFSREFAPTYDEAPLDYSASFSFGNRFVLGESADGPTLGVIGSISNKRSSSYYSDGETNRYEFDGNLTNQLSLREEKGEETNDWGNIFNIAFKPNGSHEIGLNTSYNQSGINESIYREGYNLDTIGPNALFRGRNIHYTERTLGIQQLYGKHILEHDIRVEWSYSKGKSVQDEPDYRLFYDTQDFVDGSSINADGSYDSDSLDTSIGAFNYESGTMPDPRRYWRRLDEDNEDAKIDVTVPIAKGTGSVKFGYQNIDTNRIFTERSFSYRERSSALPDDYIYDGDPNNFLDPKYLVLNGDGDVQRYVVDEPGNVPEYTGKQTIEAFYAMADVRVKDDWRIILGARSETADILVESFDADGDPKGDDGAISGDHILPSLNVTYEINDKSNLRLAVTNTIARPNFRELSPFGSFQNIGGETFVGNADLEVSEIDNFDLRYEFFPNDSDIFAVSLFVKDITNAIELVRDGPELTYENVPEAKVSGLELEARKIFSLDRASMHQLSIGGNLSLINSEVLRSQQEYTAKVFGDPNASRHRELQGQASEIGNVNLTYDMLRQGAAFTLSFNHTGERLYAIEPGSGPDVYEAPSNQLNFIYTQSLSSRMKLKFALKNLLDDSREKFIPDGGQEFIYSSYDRGLSASLSFTYDFY